ncbi:unnamed protein product [marine sediment metagenome]|uniref:Uncharacterized protein n=1 Tax=marine sediment metagenome TaxID=412755 RepID=X1H338_9ZZZZ
MGSIIDNDGTQDLEMLTFMPHELTKGSNPLYDARLEAWGTSFRIVDRA